MASIEEALSGILVERLGLPPDMAPVSADLSLFAPVSAGGLELDSLSSLEIVASLAERFNLPIDDIEPEDFRSISTLADYLRRHGVSDDAQPL